MQSFPPTIVLRHQRENLKKCSLRGLEARSDFLFFTYPKSELPDLSHYILLALDGSPLTFSDCDRGIFLLDATWRYAEKMSQFVNSQAIVERRSIPKGFRTAYPRCQNDCPNPSEGLSSIEALYIAFRILGRESDYLLDNYYWKEEFLQKNENARFSG